VVIDVFRAFSLAPYAAARGARLVPVGEVAAARELKRRHPDWLLVGERYARPLPGFDYGNSPALIEAAPIAGRTLLHTTHAGTRGLVAARTASEVLTGSLVNAAAIVRYIRARAPALVSLVCMGLEGRASALEDDTCAELLAARLEDRPYDCAGIRPLLRASPGARKFFDPALEFAPERDFELCLALDRFAFVLRLGTADAEGVQALERVEVGLG
jgi:2-phosphosulfolactate phosphatase